MKTEAQKRAQAAYLERNKEKSRKYAAEYYQKNKERLREYAQWYTRTHREKRNESNRKRSEAVKAIREWNRENGERTTYNKWIEYIKARE